MTRSTLHIYVETVQDTQSPDEGSALFRLWIHTLNNECDCVEFSAPKDLLVFSKWSDERVAWIQGWVAKTALDGDYLLGKCSRWDVSDALKNGQLTWSLRLSGSLGLGKVFHWPVDQPLVGFKAHSQLANAARLDEKLPAPNPARFKARF